MSTLTYMITHINDTYTNILANMNQFQIGITTDTFGSIGVADDLIYTNETASDDHYVVARQFKIATDGTTASYCSNNFGTTVFHNTTTFINDTAENTDGGRESILDFKGIQSGDEETTLGRIRFDHDGEGSDTNDNEKGQVMIYLNDTNDGNSPSEVFRIEADGGVFAPKLATASGTTNPVYYNTTTKELYYTIPA